MLCNLKLTLLIQAMPLTFLTISVKQVYPTSARIKNTFVNTSIYLEPISSALPKVSSHAKYDVLNYDGGTALSIICPAQGYPVPNFRLVSTYVPHILH